MRKFYLFMAGALLFSMPAFSQLKFERHAEDARQIFHQDFEVADGLTAQEAYDAWAKTPIDTIHEIEYYSKIGTSSLGSRTDIYDGSADWEIFAVRTDSTSSEWTKTNPGDGIVMFNGADPTSSKDETAAGVYDNDHWSIIGDGGTDPDRIEAFAQYGENGGKYYFQWSTGGLEKFIGGSSNAGQAYWAGKNWTSHYKSDTRSVRNYRRDLYVRGLDIEEESSYRLTFYIKVKKQKPDLSWNPLFYADVMRGYHHQRSAFSMGYKSGKEFALEKSFEDDELSKWQKITLMTYYINGHESDAYVIYKGDYSWSDDWTWRPSDEELKKLGKTLKPGEELNYVKQPDKFFVRLSFATDSMDYALDNLTLTKSWIAGCEYNNDMLRVNFGYQTNLSELVKAEKERTNMPAIEIPNENGKFFEVWCKKDGAWSFMPIRSAEYHDDGYMYMFTSYFQTDPDDPLSLEPLKFGDYDSVFVTFHNPVDNPQLTLKYTGSLYPKAHDTAWVNAGKVVPSFYNEVAVPNPTTKIWANVTSLDGLPPIMTKAPYEDGSFGLDGNITELKFKFQREIRIDPEFKGEATEYGVVAYVGDEIWIPSWDAATSSLVITRPEDLRANPLKGDHLINLVQIKGTNGDAGDPVEINYHFGAFSKVVSSTQIDSDWRSEISNFDTYTGFNPGSTYVHDGGSKFQKGKNSGSSRAKSRVYALDYPAGNPDNCGYIIINRSTDGGEGSTANVYTVVHFNNAEECIIKFKATGWKTKTEKLYLYFYPKPAGDLEDGNDKGFAILEAQTKTLLKEFTPATYVKSGDIEDKGTGTWPDGVETVSASFTVPAAGDYIFEWVTKTGDKNGVMIGNYSISSANAGNLSTPYVSKLNKAVESAQAKLTEAKPDKYRGADYNALAQAAVEGDNYMGHFPSKYDSVVAHISNLITALTNRMATVDDFYAESADVATLLGSFTGDSAKYKNLDAYKALAARKEANATWIDSLKTLDQITAEIEAYEKEVKALDDRMALIDNHNAEIEATQKIMNAADARKDYEEYDVMAAGVRTALAFDAINCTDDELEAATAALLTSRRGYIFRFDYEIAMTRQIRELFVLADSLGYDFGGKKDSIKTYVYGLTDDDPELCEVLREAAILQILKIYAENNSTKIEKMEGFDVSALMPNYFLRNEAEVDRDMDISSAGTWRIIKSTNNTTAFPGWTVYNSGTMFPGQTELDWSLDGHVFIDGIHFSPSTTGTVSATVNGLPQAYYSVGLDMLQNNLSNSKFNLTTSTDTIELKGSKFAAHKVVEIGDSVRLVDGSPLTFSYAITGSSNSGHVGINGAVIKLVNPDDKANYATLVTAQQAKLNDLITFVGVPTMKESVEFYNLSGMKINAPKAGEIVIRKTTSNGKVVVDKVLIK